MLKKHLADGLEYTEISPETLKAIKKAINLYTNDSSTFMDKGKELFYMLHETQDVKEAVSAFLEKRVASFVHK